MLGLHAEPGKLLRDLEDTMVEINRRRHQGWTYRLLTERYGKALVCVYRSLKRNERDIRRAIRSEKLSYAKPDTTPEGWS